jgi:general stress protein 26
MATLQKKPNDAAQQAEQKFLELLRGFDYAMLVSGGVEPHARPMSIAETSPDGSLWFLTGKDTQKVFELAENTDAMAVLQSSSHYISITGRARIVDDRAHIHKLWKEPMKVWFSGKDDPNIVLIRLEPHSAEYWDNSGFQGVRLALRFAKAYVTGENRDAALGSRDDVATHGKVQL